MFDKKSDGNYKNTPTASSESHDNLSNTTTANSSRTCAIIGHSIHIKGDIKGSENLVINGQVDGTIDLSSNEFSVGQSGNVNANIIAKMVRIDGKVKGDISGHEKVIVSKTGNVRGNIIASRVTLEDGAKFKGSIDMNPSNPSVTPVQSTAAEVKGIHKSAATNADKATTKDT